MRRIAILLLGIIYLVVLLRPWLPSMLFSLNERYIQTELCIQKDIKRNSCKGACFMKKLQAQQSQLQDFPGLAFEELELAQWQPIIDMTAAPVPSDPAAVTSVQNEQTVDQYQSDLPVPPPWIKDRQS